MSERSADRGQTKCSSTPTTFPWQYYVTNLSMMSANYVMDAGSGVAQYKKLRVRGLGREGLVRK